MMKIMNTAFSLILHTHMYVHTHVCVYICTHKEMFEICQEFLPNTQHQ